MRLLVVMLGDCPGLAAPWANKCLPLRAQAHGEHLQDLIPKILISDLLRLDKKPRKNIFRKNRIVHCICV